MTEDVRAKRSVRSRPALIAGILLVCACGTAWPQAAGPAGPAMLPEPSPEHLPRWRGFNLPDMVSAEWARGPFHEEDFRLIARLGFNFVRLPLDYRLWIEGGDWERIDAAAFADIDRAVQWGIRYGIHVSLNLHRAPGYCVNPPAEPRNLFTDTRAQRVCALHWAFIARRYRGIANRNLSFNLLNEPNTDDGAAYARIVSLLCEAIRREDPDRLIIADGLSWGTVPCRELVPMRVAQATRGYQPLSLMHYRADWVEGADSWPVPSWPPLPVSAYLYGPDHDDLAGPLTIEGPFAGEVRLRVRVEQVSRLSRLRIRADGRIVLDRSFRPGSGRGEWKIWQNLYDLDVFARIPAGTRSLEIANVEGDWMTFTEIGFLPAAAKAEIVLAPGDREWGSRQRPLRADLAAQERPFTPVGTDAGAGATLLWERAIRPFEELERGGVGIMVGEFGAYRFTPHAVVLAWMRDCLENWKRAGWGWALWNFRGDFGVLDSNRPDVSYESWEGHLLDRKMLELLQRS
ncbi:MAG: cellulase family glycosylhydrolase [Spirochaetes bacterium]|nr:cellulase family glycosylhydrolase [Spirochaetota bacterium]